MDRRGEIIAIIGSDFQTHNIESGEYSYVKDAGSMAKLEKALGYKPSHYKLDIRFEDKKSDVVVLVETKQKFVGTDEAQLAEYLKEEKALHKGKKIIAILANTNDKVIKVWKSEIDDEHLLADETVIDTIEHYVGLFEVSKSNDREKVLKNTYDLNELLHKKDIDEKLRSQFVGTTLLYLKHLVEKFGAKSIDESLKEELDCYWSRMDGMQLRAAIGSTLDSLLDGSKKKEKKIELLQKNVLNDQKVKRLGVDDWIEILDKILMDIYRYIDTNSSEGQDILNLFFIAFNKYTGKADKNQAFTPDHITEFMCQLTEVDRTKRVLDITCGSGSFLVQAMVKELADCSRGKTEEEAEALRKSVKEKNIYGIEVEEKAYGLSTTNMLIHGDGNSNIEFGSCFKCKEFIKKANPDIVLMNPPYNAKPIGIPAEYKKNWGKAKDGKEDPTKGLVFIQYLSDVIKEMNDERERKNEPLKTVKLAVLLPVSAAIGTSSLISDAKKYMLKYNRLDAVFSLPQEIFYPGASASACCMLFTLGEPHVKNGVAKETFFGYCKEDGFKKKKRLGRIEQFDENNQSLWKEIESEWLYLYCNKKIVDGKSSMAMVNGDDEWLCEAYMDTDWSTLPTESFERTLNNYLAYLITRQSTERGSFMNTNQWKEFLLDNLFEVKKGKRLPSDKQTEGSTPYIGAIDSNNGVDNYIGQSAIHEGNTISLSYNGSVGEAFYQPEPFWATDDVNVLYFRKENGVEFNKYIGLFICAVLRHEKYRYSYGRKWVLENMRSTMIKLPSKNDKPDWEYMENYIKLLPYGDKI